MSHPLFSDDDPTVTHIGEYAVVDERAGISISTQQRLEMALSPDPATSHHPLALTQGQAKKVTQNRIRNAMAELSHANIGKVNGWLDEVATKDPARAVELFLQLAEFTLPKLKAVAIDVKDNSGVSLKSMSVRDLEALIAGDDTVVATQ